MFWLMFYGGSGRLTRANLTFIAFLLCWVGGTTTVIVYPLKKLGYLRVSEEMERDGMDNSKHGGKEVVEFSPVAPLQV